ncbi:uncharacterized protein ACMZJ9_009973 [Mantella aurantiaca]
MTILGILLLLSLHQTHAALDVFAPSPQRSLVTNEKILNCTFLVDKQTLDLTLLAVLWSFQEKELLRYDSKGFSTQDPRMSLNVESLRDGYASLHISNVTISDGGLYKCMVIYSPESKEKEIAFEVLARPLLSIFSTKIQRNAESTLTCKATGFFPPDIGITWYRDVEVLRNQYMGKPQKDKDGTYEVDSVLTITLTDEEQNQIFSCRVQHDSLEEPLQKDFQLIYEETSSSAVAVICIILVLITIIAVGIGIFLWSRKCRKTGIGTFTVMDIEGPTKLIAEEETSLFCKATKFPENASVTWWEKSGGKVCEIPKSHGRDKERLMDTQYGVISCKEGSNCISSLKFRPSVTNHKDVTFICRYSFGKKKKEKTFHCRAIYAKPQMLQPVSQSLIVSGELKYLVTLEKFYPRNITVRWTQGVGEPQQALKSKEERTNTTDGTYSVCSEVTIPEELLKDPEFRVRVSWEHESLDSPEYKDLSIRDPEYIWTPVVDKIEAPDVFHHNALVTLQCQISEYFPDALRVTWLRRSENQELREEIDNMVSREIIPRRTADNTYSCTASLTIVPTISVHQGAEYICRVNHPSLEEPIERSTKKLAVKAIPQMVEPIEITMRDSSRVHFTLNLQKFYPEDIKIDWKFEDKYHQLPYRNTPTKNQDLTHNVTSVAHNSTKNFTDPQFKVFVTWNHQSMDKPETRTLTIKDLPWLPQVGEIIIPELKENKKISLTCNISEYFPDLLSVSWFRKEPGTDSHQKPLPNSDYKVSNKKENKEKFSCQSSLTFTYLSKKDQRSEFICRVEHPSLKHPIERTTGHIGLGTVSMNGTGNTLDRPQLSIISTKVQRHAERTLTCMATRFFPPDIWLTWYRKDEVLKNQFMGITKIYKDETYQVNSTVTITPIDDDQNQIFSCKVQHDSLQEPVQRDFQLVYDGTRTFTVMDIEGPTKLIAEEETSLICKATKFPENMSVTWTGKSGVQYFDISESHGGDKEEEERLMDTQYGVVSLKERPNYTSSLKFRPSVTKHKDVTFTCTYSFGKKRKEKTFHCRAIYAKPQMLQPVSRSLIVSGELKYSVNLENFYPRDIKIIWTKGVGEPQETLSSTETFTEEPDGTYSVCSEVTIPEDLLKDPEFRVRVSWEHESLDSPEYKDLSIRDPEYIWTPVVGKIEAPDVFNHNTLVTLQCQISEYFPDALTVTWLRRSENQELCEEIDNVISSEIIPRRAADNTYSCTASLTIVPTISVHQGAEYICRVNHPSLEEPIERPTKKLVVKAIPQMVEPIEITMRDSSHVYFTLNLQKFYPEDIKIDWTFEDKYHQLPYRNTPTKNQDLTYNVTSVAQNSTEYFTDPQFKVFVTWNHQSMDKPETRTLTIKDLPWLPKVGEIIIPELKENKKISLTCNISEYFPDLLSVSWFRKEPGTDSHQKPLPNSDYNVSNKKENKEKFSCQSSLTFTYLSKRDQRSEFICRVEHPSLVHPIERRTGPIGLDTVSMNGTGNTD